MEYFIAISRVEKCRDLLKAFVFCYSSILLPLRITIATSVSRISQYTRKVIVLTAYNIIQLGFQGNLLI